LVLIFLYIHHGRKQKHGRMAFLIVGTTKWDCNCLHCLGCWAYLVS